MPENIIKIPIEKIFPREIGGKEMWAQKEPPEFMVWEVCPYIRNLAREHCNHCPRFEDHPTYGPMQRGCYGLAAEVCRIVFAAQKRHKKWWRFW